jgi:cell pole-organizing protein PopZ
VSPPAGEPASAPIRLLAQETELAAGGAMATLAARLLSNRDSATHRGGPTIEELVREEVRPLLKDWLDQYLPPMVERLVRAEIERLGNRLAD